MSDDEFDLGSDDEADILALVDSIDRGTKRTADDVDLPPAKRVAHSDTPVNPAPGTPKTYNSALKALKTHFGFSSFRLKQEQVIGRLLSGQSAAVVFPTGGGKSLCYQIPALAFQEEDELAGTRQKGEHGITLVVSPLIALMKDQVDALVQRGIKAATLDSSKSREEYLRTCDMMRSGELKLLYCAPERLNNEGFVEQMKNVRGGIRLLAVDESHCISQWGHSFRPDYLSKLVTLLWGISSWALITSEVARFAKEINAERVVCLTATATPRVAKDICKAFDINEKEGLFRTSTYRPNLHLLAKSAPTQEAAYPPLLTFLRANTGATIIYVTLQKHTEVLALKLRADGFNARAFHAGMDIAVKSAIQEQFMRSDDLIIVATIAFGMGIDKSSIRNVIHLSAPSSLESYSQEIGRAGRDGKKSTCLFLVCGEDLHLRELFIRADLPSINSVRNVLMDIFTSSSDGVAHNKLPVGSNIKFAHYSQERDYDIRSTTLKNIYAQLELTHGLIHATTPIYTKYSFDASPLYFPRLNSDQSQAAKAIGKFAKKAAKLFYVDVDLASQSFRIPRTEVVRKLNEWNESHIIELRPAGVLNVYKITSPLPNTAAAIEDIANDLFRSLQSREYEDLHRADEMITLITSKFCFVYGLAAHFGDSLPDGKKECGHCQYCLTHTQLQQLNPPKVEVNKKLFNSILKAVAVRDDARLLAKFAFGISTPRLGVLKLSKSPLFGSMEDHGFMDLLRMFTAVCRKAGG